MSEPFDGYWRDMIHRERARIAEELRRDLPELTAELRGWQVVLLAEYILARTWPPNCH